MVHICELSYSLYLWHWTIMAFMRYHEGKTGAYYFSLFEMIFISVLTYVLAWLSYTFIENIFRTTGNKKFILSFSPAVILLMVLGYSIPVLAKKDAIAEEYIKPTFGLKSHSKKYIETFGSAFPLYDKIFLFGDSHAGAIKPFLDYIGKHHNFAFKTISTSSYPPIAGINREEIPATSMKFYDFAQTLIDTVLTESAKNDIIIINSVGFDRSPSMRTALHDFAKNLRPNQSLIILNTFPIIDRNPVKVNRSIVKSTDYNFQVSDRSENKKLIEEIASELDNVYYYDLSKSKVFNSLPFYKDTLMYYDQAHIN